MKLDFVHLVKFDSNCKSGIKVVEKNQYIHVLKKHCSGL